MNPYLFNSHDLENHYYQKANDNKNVIKPVVFLIVSKKHWKTYVFVSYISRKSQNILSIIFLRYMFFHYVYNINAFWSVFKKSLKNHCFLYHNCIIGSQSYRWQINFCADLPLFVERIVFVWLLCWLLPINTRQINPVRIGVGTPLFLPIPSY